MGKYRRKEIVKCEKKERIRKPVEVHRLLNHIDLCLSQKCKINPGWFSVDKNSNWREILKVNPKTNTTKKKELLKKIGPLVSNSYFQWEVGQCLKYYRYKSEKVLTVFSQNTRSIWEESVNVALQLVNHTTNNAWSVSQWLEGSVQDYLDETPQWSDMMSLVKYTKTRENIGFGFLGLYIKYLIEKLGEKGEGYYVSN